MEHARVNSIGRALHHLLSWLNCLIFNVTVENINLFMIINHHHLQSYQTLIGDIKMMNIAALETLCGVRCCEYCPKLPDGWSIHKVCLDFLVLKDSQLRYLFPGPVRTSMPMSALNRNVLKAKGETLQTLCRSYLAYCHRKIHWKGRYSWAPQGCCFCKNGNCEWWQNEKLS